MIRRAFIMPVIGSVNSPMETFKSAMNLRGARLNDLKRGLYEWRRRVRSRGELMSLTAGEGAFFIARLRSPQDGLSSLA